MNTKKSLFSFLAISLLAVGLAGCQKEGPAEKAGKEIDNATATAGEKMKEVGQDIHKSAEDAKR